MARFVGMTLGGRTTPEPPAEKAGEPDGEPVYEKAEGAHATDAIGITEAAGAPDQPEKIEVKEPVEPAKDDTEPPSPKPPAAKAGK